MTNKEFDKKIRSSEAYHSILAPPNLYKILRIDGRSFSKFTSKYFKGPFDIRFMRIMSEMAESCMREFDFHYCHTHSDEVSFLLSSKDNLFNGSVEKINSVVPSFAASKFTSLLRDDGIYETISFDSRIILFGSVEQAVEYFRWRQSDSWKNCVGSTLHYMLIDEKGMTGRAAARMLDGMSNSARQDTLFEMFGVNANELPSWQKSGVDLCWGKYTIKGYNPVTGGVSEAERRFVTQNWDCPVRDEYEKFIYSNLAGL